ncbi:hypothetical protein D3C76_1721490 [compost metagenome]
MYPRLFGKIGKIGFAILPYVLLPLLPGLLQYGVCSLQRTVDSGVVQPRLARQRIANTRQQA